MASYFSHPFSFPSMPLSYMIILFFILLTMISSVNSFDYYSSCANQFNCGKLTNVSFPFSGDGGPEGCGYPGMHLNCSANLTYITIKNISYLIKEVHPKSHTLKIARAEYLKGLCPSQFNSSSFNALYQPQITVLDVLDHNLFDYVSGYHNLILFYGCNVEFARNFPGHFHCPVNGIADTSAHPWLGALPPTGYCKFSVVVPVPSTLTVINFQNLPALEEAVIDGFEVKWMAGVEECDECQQSGGICCYNYNLKKITWYCEGSDAGSRIYPPLPLPDAGAKAPQDVAEKKSNANNTVVGIAVGVAAFVVILLGCCIYLVLRRRKTIEEGSKSRELFMPPSTGSSTTTTTSTSQSFPSYATSNIEPIQSSFSFQYGVQVFTYDELEEATDNFNPSKELGDGGFGIVYYGKLKDGRVVAVKRLYESSFKRVQQFMNEVRILANIRHENLVALYGCTSRHSRELLLVYEYIPNGTVADHVHGGRSKSGILRWPIRLNIAVETAQALAYLHASDVIHRDVKTNNILLDNNFRVKVADFGLSRWFPNDVTHVSTAPQGTPGYVDPEYYHCFKLTDKSDVYSFGVVLIELISSLQAVDIQRTRLDINLANMAVCKIQNHALKELVDPYLGFEKDPAIRYTITLVAELAFRCLQQGRDMRPSMNEVLAVLKGIQNQEYGQHVAEAMDNRAEEVIPLKKVNPPFSPASVADNWVSSSTISNSS